MLVSWKWLQDYVSPDVEHAELTGRWMMAGLNHESTEPVGDDLCIDLEVTSNRPDCLGHLGVAREAAVLLNRPLSVPSASPEATGPAVETLASVEVRCPGLCPRYTARVIQGVKIGPSPAWLRERLATIGIASINNVVDVTNYVMMECGQPLHAFDLNKLAGRKIVVREPSAGEKLQAINHREYALEPGMCVIADGQRAVGLGGVMGGADTEVADDTVDLLIEAAAFDPMSIRSTARKLKLHSPSSYRFERLLDPQGVDWASRRCCELILQVAGGKLAQGVLDVGSLPEARPPVPLRLNQVRRVLGIEVPPDETARILRALGCEVRISDAKWESYELQATPPSWRADLEREIDLIEEVARIHGYDKIPEDVQVPMAASSRNDDERVLARVRHVLTAAGCNEAMTASLTPPSWARYCLWPSAAPLCTAMPAIENSDTLRRSLLPSLLAARRHNETQGNQRIELFEIARIYLPQGSGENLPTEQWTLGLVSGDDFFRVKAVIAALVRTVDPAAALEVRDLPEAKSGDVADADADRSPLDPDQAAALYLNGQLLGFAGRVSAELSEQFELRGAASAAELRIATLRDAAKLVPQYVKPIEFPAMVYDMNLKVDEPIRWAKIAEVVRQQGGPLLEDVRFQETYRNPRLAGEGKKKVLFALRFRSPAGTLTHEEANQVHARILQACQSELGAELG